jgi:thymidylate synthase
MLINCVNNATEAWEWWYDRLLEQKNQQPSRDGTVVGEFLNACTVIKDPRQGLVLSKKRDLSIKYAVGELLWYLSGSNMVSAISPYSKVWEKLSDDGETVNSAYGHRIYHKFGFDQWEYVKGLLKADPLSRQAVIHIKEPNNQPTKDLPCTICIQYFIRDNRLHSTVYMRSNDIWMGFPYDVFCFTSLQVKMAMELGVNLGEYTHIAGSLHLYERNVK